MLIFFCSLVIAEPGPDLLIRLEKQTESGSGPKNRYVRIYNTVTLYEEIFQNLMKLYILNHNFMPSTKMFKRSICSRKKISNRNLSGNQKSKNVMPSTESNAAKRICHYF